MTSITFGGELYRPLDTLLKYLSIRWGGFREEGSLTALFYLFGPEKVVCN